MSRIDDLKKKIEQGLHDAFKSLSPQDLDKLYQETAGYSVKEWQNFQLAAAAAGGAAGGAVPVAHLAGLAADLLHVIYRMARTSLGTGAIMGRHEFNDNIVGDEDFFAVLAQWSDPESLGDIVRLKLEGITGKVSAKTVGKVAAKAIVKHAGIVAGGAIANKLFTKVLGKFIAKLLAKVWIGFIPGVGALFSAGVDAWFITKVNEASVVFYPKKIRLIAQHR